MPLTVSLVVPMAKHRARVVRQHCCCAPRHGRDHGRGAGSSPVCDDAVGQNADYAALTKVGGRALV